MGMGSGKLFAVGGVDNSGGCNSCKRHKSMEWIELANGVSWTKVDLPFSVFGHCITKLNATHIMLTGGLMNMRVSKSRIL